MKITPKINRILLVFFAALLLVALFFVDDKKERGAESHQSQKAVVRCTEEPLVRLGDVVLQVPYNSYIKFKDGKTPGFGDELIVTPSTIRDCDKIIEGAVNINHVYGAPHEKVTTWYTRFAKEIEQAQKQGDVEKIENGIERIKLTNSELYLLPLASSPTKDGRPVVFSCGDYEENRESFHPSQFCSTSYVLPSGFIIRYRFFRRMYKPKNYLSVDKKYRDQLESRIFKAKETLEKRREEGRK